MALEEDARDQKLAEQEILRQALEAKNQRIRELEAKVELLEGMINRLGSLRTFPQPLPQPLPQYNRPAPRRWSVR